MEIGAHTHTSQKAANKARKSLCHCALSAMAPSNRIWSLKDVTNGEPDIPKAAGRLKGKERDGNRSGNGDTSNPSHRSVNNNNPLRSAYCQPVSKSSASAGSLPTLHHIPNLTSADVCAATLKRVLDEFGPIIQKRGYRVLSVSEMCCCGDGLDYDKKRRGRKLRKQSNNVLGYNSTRFFGGRRGGSKTHTIHLRLRDPRNHNRLYPWEDVAGTMAHELSHCVHQNHGSGFYKLMEELLEEHATMQANSLGWKPIALNADAMQQRRNNSATAAGTTATNTDTGDGGPTPIFPSGGGHRLGGGDGKRGRNGARIGDWGKGQQLGGGRARLSAREAAARAAEFRQQQLDRVKRMVERAKEPCVIEILDDSDEEEEYADTKDYTKMEVKKPSSSARPKTNRKNSGGSGLKPAPALKKAKHESKKPPPAAGIIDMTGDDSTSPTVTAAKSQRSSRPSSAASEGGKWSCNRCTFENQDLALVCSMCNSERW